MASANTRTLPCTPERVRQRCQLPSNLVADLNPSNYRIYRRLLFLFHAHIISFTISCHHYISTFQHSSRHTGSSVFSMHLQAVHHFHLSFSSARHLHCPDLPHDISIPSTGEFPFRHRIVSHIFNSVHFAQSCLWRAAAPWSYFTYRRTLRAHHDRISDYSFCRFRSPFPFPWLPLLVVIICPLSQVR